MGEQKVLADASRVDAIREHLHEWEREGALDTGKRYALQLLALVDAWAREAANIDWLDRDERPRRARDLSKQIADYAPFGKTTGAEK